MIKSNLFRNFRSLLAGAFLAQLIYLCTLPILSSLYGPAEFGAFAVILASGNILAVALGLRYEMAIVMPRQIQGAFNLLVAVHGLAFFITLLLSIVLGLLSSYWDVAYFDNWLLMVLLAFLLFSFGACNYFLHKIECYGVASALMVLKVILVFLAQFLWGGGEVGLIAGQVLGSFIVFVFGLVFIALYQRRQGLSFSLRKGIALCRMHHRFPRFSLPAALMNAMGSNLPVILIEALLGKHVAGLFSMANRLVLAPVSLLAGNLNNAFIQEVRKRILGRKPVLGIMRRVAFLMACAGVVGALAIYLFVRLDVVVWVLGDNWAEVGKTLVWLLPLVVFSMVSTGISRFSVFERHELGFYFQLLLMCVSVGSIGLAAIFFDEVSVVILSYALSMSCVFALQISVSFKLARNNDSEP